MRVLFASVGAHGHLIPLLPLAAAVRDAGHEVVFATHERFHPILEQASLEAVAAGGTVRDAIASVLATTPPDRRAEASPQAFGSLLPRRAAADLAPLLSARKPDLVVYEILNPGAGIAANLAGIPAVSHGLGRISGAAAWSAMCETWVDTAADLGARVPSENPEFLGNPYLDLCPPSLAAGHVPESVPLISLRPQPWRQAAPLPRIVSRRAFGRPLVYLTFGTAFANAELMGQAITGLARLPVDVLVATGPSLNAADLGDLPANVVVEKWVPQAEVLAHVALVVSHGGSGTMFGALVNGVPQLMLPQGADQFSNARTVAAAGLGRQILPADLTSDAIAEHSRALLDDEHVRITAELMAKEIESMPSPQDTVDQLIQIRS